jgi:hypothetical protein
MHAPYNAPARSTPAPSVYLGKDLANRARKSTATERALLAVELSGGVVDRLTPQQATKLAGANQRYVSTLRGMTELERAAVKGGRLKLADRVNQPSDAKIDELVQRIGPARVMDALDRITKPASVAA